MLSENKNKKHKKRVFEDTSDDLKHQLLSERKSVNTNKATETYVTALCEYLAFKNMDPLDIVTDENLPQVLADFYSEVCTPKGEIYCVQSYKCIHSALNRYFQDSRRINIISDTRFIGANAMFDAMKVNAKKVGKGVRKPTIRILNDDMMKLGVYFMQDMDGIVDPKKFQQCLMFYIIYYFCRRGRENLKEMKLNTYIVYTDEKGKKFVKQNIDEMDKNHNADNDNPTNNAKMYENKGLQL